MRRLECLCKESLLNAEKSEVGTSQRPAAAVHVDTDVTGVERIKEPGQSVSCLPK